MTDNIITALYAVFAIAVIIYAIRQLAKLGEPETPKARGLGVNVDGSYFLPPVKPPQT